VALGVFVSLAALAVILYFVDLRRVWIELLQADRLLLSAGGVITFAWLLVRTIVWRSLLRQKAAYGPVFFTLSEGYLLNNIFPFRLGEVGRAFLLSRKAPVRFMEVLTTILLERSFDILFAASLVLAVLPLLDGQRSASLTPGVDGASSAVSWAGTATGGAAVILGLAALFVMARFPSLVWIIFRKVTARSARLQSLGERFLTPFLDGLAVLKDPRSFLVTVAWFLINLTLGVLQYYVVIRAFFPDAGLLWALFSLGVSSIGWALPSSPGGIGVYEGAIVVSLAVFSPDTDKAFACGVILHFWNYFFTTIIGSYALMRDGESLTSLYARVRQARTQGLPGERTAQEPGNQPGESRSDRRQSGG